MGPFTPRYALPDLPLAANAKFSGEVMLWLGVIVGLGILLAIVAMVLRKKLLARDDSPEVGFTLKDLRRLHAEGQLSDEELRQAEAKTLSASRSRYLGESADAPGGESASLDGPSTNDPPARAPGAENEPDDPDKNGGGGPPL